MISVIVDAGYTVNFFDSKVVTKKTWIFIMSGESESLFDVVSMSVVEFIDKHRNENDPWIFSIKLFGKDDNDMKLNKQLTTIVPNDWNNKLFAVYLCEVVMKQANTLFIYLNPENDNSIEDISGLNTLYKESISKLIFDSYSPLA